MPPVTVEQRIRKGLKFLAKSDKAVIRSAVILEVLEEISNPQGVAALLKPYKFKVGPNSFIGIMTKGQSTYLKGYTQALETFADAISRILIQMNANIPKALTDLGAALAVPMAESNAPKSAARTDGPGGIVTPTLGCCTFDTNQQEGGISESFCEGGLAGTWLSGPCIGKP